MLHVLQDVVFVESPLGHCICCMSCRALYMLHALQDVVEAASPTEYWKIGAAIYRPSEVLTIDSGSCWAS